MSSSRSPAIIAIVALVILLVLAGLGVGGYFFVYKKGSIGGFSPFGGAKEDPLQVFSLELVHGQQASKKLYLDWNEGKPNPSFANEEEALCIRPKGLCMDLLERILCVEEGTNGALVEALKEDFKNSGLEAVDGKKDEFYVVGFVEEKKGVSSKVYLVEENKTTLRFDADKAKAARFQKRPIADPSSFKKPVRITLKNGLSFTYFIGQIIRFKEGKVEALKIDGVDKPAFAAADQGDMVTLSRDDPASSTFRLLYSPTMNFGAISGLISSPGSIESLAANAKGFIISPVKADEFTKTELDEKAEEAGKAKKGGFEIACISALNEDEAKLCPAFQQAFMAKTMAGLGGALGGLFGMLGNLPTK